MSAYISRMHSAIVSTDQIGNAARNARCPMAARKANATPTTRAHILPVRIPTPTTICRAPRTSQYQPHAVKSKTRIWLEFTT
ncbi:hypothetical protein ACFQY7_43640 [Actinomadura luteofluorescens]|uniref:hypothetical protein n=1 Tax=Actinomadura luteofluorescens TaxID=46163 RepID=UPI00363F1C30